jgi:cellulose synthase/poly-beta-1,6-N-acetylglucosamine synthase-like glycosyltransferase
MFDRMHEDGSAFPSYLVEPPPYLLPVMNTRQQWTFRGLVAVWLGTLVIFWTWWLQVEHWVTPWGLAVNSFVLFWTTVLPGWFFFFAHRMRRPNPELPIPPVRVAIVVTKAPAEPWPVVQETLEGMLRQDYPYPYDTWLADEAPSAATLNWCALHSVKVSSREGVAEYHRSTWPRRTKCKEGNLAYFYDRWGYRDYDVVAQLDADHVPTPRYLQEMVRPFADPAVGYVAAPSVNDKNLRESWAVRGRLYKEKTFHGPQQAGQSGDFAPSCIGSHYAVRTTALKEIGGLGPELAEDFTTSLMMASFGWRGVFALDAEAHGDGPACFSDYIVQEFQWSRSLMNVLLGINHRYWAGLTIRGKIKMGFAQAWYPLTALHMSVAVLLPICAVLTDTPWMNISLPEFFLRLSPVTLASLGIIAWLRRQGWLRPQNGKLLSWELVLFEFTQWVWVFWGVTQSIAGWALRKHFGFKVTPKGTTGPKPLPVATLVPYLAIAWVSALVAVYAGDAGPARGYYVFCLWNAVIYVLVTLAIVLLHIKENRDRLAISPIRYFGPQLAALAISSVLVVVAVALRSPVVLEVLAPVWESVWSLPGKWPVAGSALPMWIALGAGAVLLPLLISIFGLRFDQNTGSRESKGDK